MINVDAYGAETWYYYYADALGSVRLMTDAAGTPVESYSYDVYGRPYVMNAAGADGNWLTEDAATSDHSTIGNPYMFTARRWDSDGKLYYYRFRDYDPQLGRFLQCDPAGYIDTMNLYAYCGNNPIRFVDPFGLYEWDTGDLAGSIGGGAAGGAVVGGMVGGWTTFGTLAAPGAGAGAVLGAIGGGVTYVGGWAISSAWDAIFGDPDETPDATDVQSAPEAPEAPSAPEAPQPGGISPEDQYLIDLLEGNIPYECPK